MARHAINAEPAFERLRDHSQHNGRKLSDVAAAVVESHSSSSRRSSQEDATSENPTERSGEASK